MPVPPWRAEGIGFQQGMDAHADCACCVKIYLPPELIRGYVAL
jgi:hypothetical protein